MSPYVKVDNRDPHNGRKSRTISLGASSDELCKGLVKMESYMASYIEVNPLDKLNIL